MPEQLLLDGKPVDVGGLDQAQREFHAAMAEPAADEPAAPAPPRVDNEAPYGRKANGEARKRPAGPGRPRAAKTAAGKTQPTETPQDVSQRRTDGVESLVNVGAAVCLGVSTRLGDAYKADALVLSSAAKPLALACNEVAEQDPRFAKILDRITASGPYAALAATAVPIVAQLAMNHGVKAMAALNAVPPEELLRQLDNPDESNPTPEG